MDKNDATGNPSLDGWMYQCDVSVWAALDLLLVQGVSTAVQLEPASQEDIEAELESPAAASGVALGSTLLVIQAKLRRSGQWTPATMKALVEHGTQRPSAVKRLKEDNVRYLLVTSADVNPDLQPLLVEDFLEKLDGVPLPSSVFDKTLAKSAVGRFSILGLHTEQRVVERIERILMSPLSVPRPQLKNCLKHLREVAIARMREGSTWLRSEIETIIRVHGGAMPADATNDYVQPNCWGSLLHRIETDHAVIIVGPSGTGKTTTAWALAANLRLQYAGLAVVPVESPADIRQYRHEGPVLFYLDDPWGKYEITNDRQPWTVDLPGFLHRAGPGRKFVVTTRSDIFREALVVPDAFSRWELSLEPGDYGPQQRQQLYRNRLERLPSGTLKAAALVARQTVLEALATPFEIDRFFNHLKAGPSPQDRDEGAFIRRILASTQRDAIEVEVSQLVAARAAVHWAAVLWGLMAAYGGVNRPELPDIRRHLSRIAPLFKSGLDSLVNALVAGGSLRQPGSKLSYAHPRVELGLLSAMQGETEVAEDALHALLSVLVVLDRDGPGRSSETAARVYARMLAKTAFRHVSSEAQGGIDRWIAHALSLPDKHYAGLVNLAAAVGSAGSIPAEVARWLLLLPGTRNVLSDSWDAPERTDAWYALAKADPLTKRICAMFIVSVLPVDSASYPAATADFLDRLANGLDEAWRGAALGIVSDRYLPNGRVIAYGAMRYPENQAAVLEVALAHLESIRPETQDPSRMLEIEDGYLDEEGFEEDDDSGENASALCHAYIAQVRAAGNWQQLSDRAYLDQLLPYWVAALRDLASGDIPEEELATVFDHAMRLEQDRLAWGLAERCWLTRFETRMRSCLRNGHPDQEAGLAVARCALLWSPQVMRDEVAFLARQAGKARLYDLLFEAGEAHEYGLKEVTQAYRRFVATLPPPYDELAALFGSSRAEQAALSDDGFEHAARDVSECTGQPQAVLLRAIAATGPVPLAPLRAVLGATEPDTVMIGLRIARSARQWDMIEPAVAHPRADVRRLAFELQVEANGGAIEPQWLALADDRSSRVRMALAQALTRYTPEGALPALAQLCSDKWVRGYHAYEKVFPIARKAAKALVRLPVIPDVHAQELLTLARETRDAVLQWEIHLALAVKGSDTIRATLAQAALADGPTQLRTSAMHALASAGPVVLETTLVAVTVPWLSGASASLAVWGAIAAGNCASASQVDELGAGLAAAPLRRVLLIALALGAHERSEELAVRVLRHLPPGHPARGLFATDVRLHWDLVEDLGDAEMITAVLENCADLIPGRTGAVDRA